MRTLPDYTIAEEIASGLQTVLYRGHRQRDGMPVIIKLLKNPAPTPAELSRLQYEYTVVRDVPDEGILHPYAVEPLADNLALVFEDFPGLPLSQVIAHHPLDITTFLAVALQLAHTLGVLHSRSITHKDLNPQHMLFAADTSTVKLFDFSIASRLTRDTTSFRQPAAMDGTLHYMSPEQTGRMNRELDYRTDFYSLGVTFYELVTGQVPFAAASTLDVIHAHIAHLPTPPHELARHIPPAISAIILKLLAKHAEDRYQSAQGLAADVREAQRQWQETGRIATFPLGRADIADRFLIPQKLYGRQWEQEVMLAAFARVRQGASELLLLSGPTGIGKTTLAQEIHKPMTGKRGFFVAGAFDQFQQHTPYAALIQAFRVLVRQLLDENETELAPWRFRLRHALHENGQVLTDVIPEMERLIGSQPDVPVLSPNEAQNRFRVVFQNFVQLFAGPEHPLVLFLDNLHWADLASLRVLELLLGRSHAPYLLVIGAYRDNEVDPAHPLAESISAIEASGARVHHLRLDPLELASITHLVAETLHCSLQHAEPLGEVILRKTNGSPFFVHEFLQALHQQQVIAFDADAGVWRWSLEAVESRDVSANVAEFLATKVEELADDTQSVLKLAACIGMQFDLETLALAGSISPLQAEMAITTAVNAGLLLPIESPRYIPTYQFAHSRIWQAVYDMIPDMGRRVTHWSIGQILLRNYRHDPDSQPAGAVAPAATSNALAFDTSTRWATHLDDHIFDVVYHLNAGRAFCITPDKRAELAALNFQAGRQAREAAAYDAALEYLKVAMELLPEDTWQEDYATMLALYEEVARIAYLNGNLNVVERLIVLMLRHARSLLDKVRVYEMKILVYKARGQHHNALRLGLRVLAQLEQQFPVHIHQGHILLALARTRALLLGKGENVLLNLPAMSDPQTRAAMRLLESMIPAAFVAMPTLLPLLVCQQIELSLLHGKAPETALAASAYGTVLLRVLGDAAASQRYSRLALRLSDHFQRREIRARVLVAVHATASQRREPLHTSLQPCLEAYSIALETGDLEWATYAATLYASYATLTGANLSTLYREMESHRHALTRVQTVGPLVYHALLRQYIRNLLALDGPTHLLAGEAYTAEAMLPVHEANTDRVALFGLYLVLLHLCYLAGEYAQAVAHAVQAHRYLDVAVASVSETVYYAYAALARLALLPSLPPRQQQQQRQFAAADQKKLQERAERSPAHYQALATLVQAEWQRAQGNDDAARLAYDRAIAQASAHGYLPQQALAHELAGQFYLVQRQPRVAQAHLTDAYELYQRWGAAAKVAALEARSPYLAKLAEQHDPTRPSEPPRSAGVLDATSVVRAAQAISGEIVLESLLSNLMHIMLENAGAERGMLILERAGAWVVEAEGTMQVSAGTLPGLVDTPDVRVLQAVPIANAALPLSIIEHVGRTQESVLLPNAAQDARFLDDSYIASSRPVAVLCLPLIHQGALQGMLYLENNAIPGAFSAERLELLRVLCVQAAISIEHARLYTYLEELVAARTAELKQQKKHLQTLIETSPTPVVVTDQHGCIIAWNPAAEQLSGYRAEDALGQPLQALLTPAQPASEAAGEWRQVPVMVDGQEMGCLVLRAAAEHPPGHPAVHPPAQ